MAEEGIKVENIKDIAAAIGKSVASNLAKGDKNAAVLGKERARETAKEMSDFKDILLDIRKSLSGSVADAAAKDKKSGGLIAGILGGVGKGIGAIAKSIMKVGPRFIIGMASLGAGLVAFMVALGGGAKIAEMVGIDGESLKKLVSNTFGAFRGIDLAFMSLIIGAAMGIAKLKISKVGVALGMGAIGMGIAAFVLGILAAEGFAKIGDLIALDGSNLAKLMTNVFGAFKGIEVKDLALILAGAVVLDKVPGGKGGVMRGMLAIGGGVASFVLGILAAEGFAKLGDLIGLDGGNLNTLLSNFFSAFKGISIEALGVMLVAAGAIGIAGVAGAKAAVIGMGAIGAGVAAFTIGLLVGEGAAKLGSMLGLDGSNLATLMTNLGTGIGGFIGGIGKGMFKQLEELDADKLTQLGTGISGIGRGIADFAKGKILGVIGNVMGALGSIFGGESPIDTIIRISKDKDIDAPRLAELGAAIGPLGEGLASFSGFELKGGFFSGETDLEGFVNAIAKIGSSDVKIDAGRIKTIGDAMKPLSDGMAGFSGLDIGQLVGAPTTGFGKTELELFFLSLSGDAIKEIDTAAVIRVSPAITKLATGMKSFGGIDMDAITGGVGEDNLGKFFEGMAQAENRIKDPNKLVKLAPGVDALGKAMQSWVGVDGDQITSAVEAIGEMSPQQIAKMEATVGMLAGSQVMGRSGASNINITNVDASSQTQNNMNRSQTISVSGEDPHNRNSTLQTQQG